MRWEEAIAAAACRVVAVTAASGIGFGEEEY